MPRRDTKEFPSTTLNQNGEAVQVLAFEFAVFHYFRIDRAVPVQRPLNTGVRFSTNARAASR
jgi:hypothetical protein